MNVLEMKCLRSKVRVSQNDSVRIGVVPRRVGLERELAISAVQ